MISKLIDSFIDCLLDLRETLCCMIQIFRYKRQGTIAYCGACGEVITIYFLFMNRIRIPGGMWNDGTIPTIDGYRLTGHGRGRGGSAISHKSDDRWSGAWS
jgi:hypothetical protein